MKSNITDLPSDAESMRRLMPEMLERIRGRLEFLKQLDAPMTPQEDLPISEFVSVGMDEAERSLVIQLGFVKFAIRFKSAIGGIRVHHNSHQAREVAAFQVIASDADNGIVRARFRIVVLRDTNARRITRWAYATKPLIEELVNAIIEVYRRFVFESHTLDTALASVVISRNSISMKYNITTEVPNEEH